MFGLRKKEAKQELPGYIRKAYHSGSWYSSCGKELNEELTGYLHQVTVNNQSCSSEGPQSPLRGIVSPHAGFSYSGQTAAYAYQALMETMREHNNIQHIVVLHPSHHKYLDGCAVSGASFLETPLGSLQVDDEIRNELLATGKFTIMEKNTDEEEHSGEMQYPYIAKALADSNKLESIKVIPIMIGSIDSAMEKKFGKILAPILARTDVISIISSDFCHWGDRFRYQPTSGGTSIFEFIEEMDRKGMNHIEMQNPGAFARYLKQTSNTICGRHAISVWLNAVEANRDAKRELLYVSFLRYAQSSQAKSMADSSVSYASAIARTNTQLSASNT